MHNLSTSSNATLWTKVLLLSLAAISHRIGLTAPNPPPSDKGSVYKGQLFEKVVHTLAITSQISTIMALLFECLVLVSRTSHSHQAHVVFSTLCPYPSTTLTTNMPALSLSFLVGVTTMLLSAALRVWCFNTLGNMFTYEVSIKPQHTLITYGPYRFARHSSYTGVVLMLLSAAVTCLAHGSYINECGLMQTPAWYPIRLWEIIAVFASTSLWRRVKAEETGLQKEFGAEWVQYTKAVPYRFIPYLF